MFDTGFKGGVKVLSTPEQVQENAAKMLGNSLITKQTGPEGQKVAKVLVHEGVSFKKELYFAIVLDRAAGGPCIVASPMGGVDIEEVAEKHPEQIHKVCCTDWHVIGEGQSARAREREREREGGGGGK